MTQRGNVSRDQFAPFDPDRELDAVLARIQSSKVAQALRYWNSLRGGNAFPSHDDIDPAEIKAILPHVMITGISYEPFRVLYRLVGTEVVRWSRMDFTNRYADELIFQDDGRDWTDYYRAVVEAHQPAFGVTDWVEVGRNPLWVEFLICPLSDDGQVINRCIAIEDYEPMSAIDIESLPPVSPRPERAPKKESE
ncbi:MAG: PAS domain-containing protein [Dongiaceae bacterium]